MQVAGEELTVDGYRHGALALAQSNAAGWGTGPRLDAEDLALTGGQSVEDEVEAAPIGAALISSFIVGVLVGSVGTCTSPGVRLAVVAFSEAVTGAMPSRKGLLVSATEVSRAPIGRPVSLSTAPNWIAGER